MVEPEIDPRQPRRYTLGLGKYRAQRVADKIILHAVGQTPTPNYKAWLRRPGGVGSADYELWWMPPADTSIELPTPFSVHVSFRAGLDAELVRVRDAAGVHAVDVEVMPEPDRESTALVFLHYANQYDLHHQGKTISFTQANVAGDPLLSYGDRYFYGDQIELQNTAIGELITVTLEERPGGERWRLSVLLPRTWVSSYESATIEALVIETVVHGLAGGPPPGQEIEFERTNKVTGQATFIVA
jgi:hypothetical protein